MTELERILGYEFRDRLLLQTALTHSSYLNEHGLKKTECNERLEFFGDAFLEIVSTEYLYKKFPELMEGDLSKIRAHCVSEKSLSEAALSIRLGEFLKLGKGTDLDGGRTSKAILSDAFEALLAALYLDGGKQKAEELIHRYVLIHLADDSSDSKSVLQEMAQNDGKTVSYRIVSENGPEHNREFVCEAFIGGTRYCTGTGKSKKAAETAAADATIKYLRGKNHVS